MGELIAVSKAAHLLGMGRRELQQMIHDGELHAFEGKVDIDEVCRCYPHLAREQNAFTERLALIKRSAFSRRVGSVVAPDHGALEQQLQRRTTEAGVQKARADKYQQIVDGLFKELAARRRGCGDDCRELIDHLNGWLLERANGDGRPS
ncbi:hypothetical protein [Endothiovibrio diazotrophicus]